jgi:phage tail-like protein
MDPSGMTTEISAQIALAASAYNRYPGEELTLHLRFTPPGEPGAVVQLVLPHVLKVDSFDLPDGVSQMVPSLILNDQVLIFELPLEKHFQPGQVYEVAVHTTINTFRFDQFLIIEASVLANDAAKLACEEIQVAVHEKGHYLKYLPEIYENDDFTSRFMMLFESFWKPISQQIDQVENTFDPGLTPPEFVPWLASWVGLPIDATLPLERQRSLLKSAMMFFQYRGTYQALKTYLEIYTSGTAWIIERRAKNFVLGETTTMGVETALGTDNRPNTVKIQLSVPVCELERTHYTEEMYTRKMTEIVRWMVPAHTIFDVKCEFIPEITPEPVKRIQP